jgi:hypothetical protein
MSVADWSVSRWYNSEPLSLPALHGSVVMIHAFQMLCPGCVLRGTPQAQRVHELFRGSRLRVIGLHTVFEHHTAMRPESLQAFLHEFKITFPVGVDEAGTGDLPQTMARFGLRGTPSTLLIDAQGNVRHRSIGGHEDLLLGAEIAALLAEARYEIHASSSPLHGYDDEAICRVPIG